MPCWAGWRRGTRRGAGRGIGCLRVLGIQGQQLSRLRGRQNGRRGHGPSGQQRPRSVRESDDEVVWVNVPDALLLEPVGLQSVEVVVVRFAWPRQRHVSEALRLL